MNMRKLSVFIVSIAILLSLGCSTESKINGSSNRTVNLSMRSMSKRLPSDVRVEFEVAFWVLKDIIKDRGDFQDAVDGQTVSSLVEVAKKAYDKERVKGVSAYTKYNSWDDMINTLQQERRDQSLPKSKSKKDSKRDKDNNLLYEL